MTPDPTHELGANGFKTAPSVSQQCEIRWVFVDFQRLGNFYPTPDVKDRNEQ
jgi:hypothetical protein